ncbi:hypothetical protein AB0H83_43700, partial [Dactylosporangium sp. NPDC050688]
MTDAEGPGGSTLVSSEQGEHDAAVRFLVIVGAVVLGAGGVVGLLLWLAGQLAALLSGNGWPDAGPGDAPGILVRFVQHPSDPALAWPEAARSSFGPTWLFLFIL